MRRLAVAIAVLLTVSVLVLVGARAPAPDHPTKLPDTEILPGAHWERDSGLGPSGVKLDLRLAVAEVDPCYDFHDLERGQGAPDRQAWHNSLRTDGGEPDYLRYWVACQVEGDGGPTWNPAYSHSVARADRRWSTDEYECARGLLYGEHGGLPWNTDHHNGEGVNIPQAKPVSKVSWLDQRGQLRWFVDYVNGVDGGPFHTPHPCHAGY